MPYQNPNTSAFSAPTAPADPIRLGDVNIFNVVTQFNADPTGATDCSSAFTAAATAAALVSGTVYIPAGTYKITNVVLLPPHVTWKFDSAATLVNAQVFSAGLETKNVFHSGRYAIGYLVPATIITTTALSALPALGTTSVSIAAHTAGAKFLWIVRQQGLDINNADKVQIFRIQTVTGTGPYTITLDRAVRWPFESGDLVYETSAEPTNIEIEGHGATITGPGDAPWQLIETQDCEIRHVHVDQTGAGRSSWAGMFDIGAFRCRAIDCSHIGSDYGFVFATAESCELVRYKASIPSTASSDIHTGITMYDCLDCTVTDSETNAVVVGITVSSNGFGTFGGDGIKIVRHRANDNSIYGYDLALGTRISLQDCEAQRCGVGLYIQAGCSLVTVDGLDVSGCGIPLQCYAVNTRLSRIRDVRSTANSNDLQILADGCVIERSYLDLTAKSGGVTGWHCAATNVFVRDSILTPGATNYAIYAVSGTTWISRCKFEGASGSPAYVAAGAVAVFEDCDFGSLFANIVIASGGQSNIGPTASLPTALIGGKPGTRGYAINGLKPSELTGHGTGIEITQSANGTWYTGLGVAVAA